MKDKIARYLFVDSTNITKTIYKSHRELIANENTNIYEKDIIMCASKIFKKNNVPKDFRKIIIKLNCLLNPINEKDMTSSEFISGKQMKLSVCRNGSTRTFKCTNEHDFNLFNWYFAPQNEFLINDKLYSYKYVKEYLNKIKENGCLEDYLKSLYEVFRFTYFEYEEDKFIENSKEFVLKMK